MCHCSWALVIVELRADSHGEMQHSNDRSGNLAEGTLSNDGDGLHPRQTLEAVEEGGLLVGGCEARRLADRGGAEKAR